MNEVSTGSRTSRSARKRRMIVLRSAQDYLETLNGSQIEALNSSQAYDDSLITQMYKEITIERARYA